MAPIREAGFWDRMGVGERGKDMCLEVLRSVYDVAEYTIEECKEQGYCSFTMVVSRTNTETHTRSAEEKKEISLPRPLICQIRPASHSLDMKILRAARNTYGVFAPKVKSLDLRLPEDMRAYEMNMLPGTPLSRLLPRTRKLDGPTRMNLESLIGSFARVIASALSSAKKMVSSDTTTTSTSFPSRSTRADSPMSEYPIPQSQSQYPFPHCTGKVGSQILPKLSKLARELPDQALRLRAQKTLEHVQDMRDYPVVLNHGDLIATNVLVDDDKGAWEVSGLVDWAEAEWLPFGTCLYGVEGLLGFLEMSSRDRGDTKARRKFVYFEGAEELRGLFWKVFMQEVKRFGERGCEDVDFRDVMVMRDVGVLLWYGYAWDEGRIDRVVNERDDAEELECLRAFLGVPRNLLL